MEGQSQRERSILAPVKPDRDLASKLQARSLQELKHTFLANLYLLPATPGLVPLAGSLLRKAVTADATGKRLDAKMRS